MVFSQKEINLRYQKFFNGEETIRLGVAVALINQKNEILLEKRSDCGWWGVTGGKLDLGETVQDCAVREIKEECSVLIEPKLLSLVGVYSDPKEGRICMRIPGSFSEGGGSPNRIGGRVGKSPGT